MALTTKTDLITIDLVFEGQPFINIARDNTTVFGTLDLIYQGQPFAPYTDQAPAGTYNINIGSTNITKVYLGSTEILKIYIGDTVIFSTS